MTDYLADVQRYDAGADADSWKRLQDTQQLGLKSDIHFRDFI